MKYSDFVKEVATRSGVKISEAKKVLEATSLVIMDAVKKDGEVTFNDLGKFTKKVRPAREGVNPFNGKPMSIAESNAVVFKPAKAFKDHLNS